MSVRFLLTITIRTMSNTRIYYTFSVVRYLIGVILIFSIPHQTVANNTAVPEPFDRTTFDFDSGALFSVGSRASPLNYIILPQNFSIRSKPILRYDFFNGTVVLRNRVSFLIEPIVHGPETYFMGLAAAPSIEWWSSSRVISAFFSIGGGFGWMDSKGYTIPGAQGQDFNLTWLMHGGIRLKLTDQLSTTTGLLFQHISNGGMDHVNPGIDSLGPTAGVSWQF